MKCMVLQRGGRHWSRLLPSETFDKSCLTVLLKTYNPWCHSPLVCVSSPDGGWLLPQVLSHPSCSCCPSCLSLGEALSGRWVDLSFSLCGRSACVSLYFLGIVERSQAGHLGTGASGRQTPQAPGTSTTFSTFFPRQPLQCKYCTTGGETSEQKVFGPVTLPVTANHVIPVHVHQLQFATCIAFHTC